MSDGGCPLDGPLSSPPPGHYSSPQTLPPNEGPQSFPPGYSPPSRNLKKYKLSSGKSGSDHSSHETFSTENRKRPSFKETLLGTPDPASPKLDDAAMEEYWFEDDGDEDEEDPECPTISITKEEFVAMCRPWKKALIVKVLGKKVGFSILHKRIVQL